jgi:hypothetical protein
LLTVSRNFMNVANSVLWRMANVLKANKVNLFVSSVLSVFWYHLLNLLDTPRMLKGTKHGTSRHAIILILLSYSLSYVFLKAFVLHSSLIRE